MALKLVELPCESLRRLVYVLVDFTHQILKLHVTPDNICLNTCLSHKFVCVELDYYNMNKGNKLEFENSAIHITQNFHVFTHSTTTKK